MRKKIFPLICLITMCSLSEGIFSVYAQDSLALVGKPEKIFSVPIDNFFSDYNGKKVSGIYVNSGLYDLEFTTGTGFVKVKERGHGYTVFISKDEEILAIEKDEFVPLTLDLTKLGIKLESGRVSAALDIGTTKEIPVGVEIIADQCGYDLIIDNEKVYVDGFAHKVRLNIGEHSIELKKAGFAKEDQLVMVSETGSNIFSFQLSDSLYSRSLVSDVFSEYVVDSEFDNVDRFKFADLYIASPNKLLSDTLTITKPSLNIKGFFEGDGEVSLLVVNGKKVTVSNDKTFDADVQLCPGTNKIIFFYEDDSGSNLITTEVFLKD